MTSPASPDYDLADFDLEGCGLEGCGLVDCGSQSKISRAVIGVARIRASCAAHP